VNPSHRSVRIRSENIRSARLAFNARRKEADWSFRIGGLGAGGVSTLFGCKDANLDYGANRLAFKAFPVEVGTAWQAEKVRSAGSHD